MVKCPTPQRLFKNFPMCQTVYSNVNRSNYLTKHNRNILSLEKLSNERLFILIKLFIPAESLHLTGSFKGSQMLNKTVNIRAMTRKRGAHELRNPFAC